MRRRSASRSARYIVAIVGVLVGLLALAGVLSQPKVNLTNATYEPTLVTIVVDTVGIEHSSETVWTSVPGGSEAQTIQQRVEAVLRGPTDRRKILSAEHPVYADLNTGSDTLLDAIFSGVSQPPLPPELNPDSLLVRLPRSENVMVQYLIRMSEPDLLAAIQACEVANAPDLDHFAVTILLREDPYGRRVYMAGLLGLKILPRFDVTRFNAGENRFYAHCGSCDREFRVFIEDPEAVRGGAMSAQCVYCQRVFAFIAMDTSYDFRDLRWFFKGHQPWPVTDFGGPWRHVLGHVDYREDHKGYKYADVWQTAAETERRRKGDCEDSSIWLADWLNTSGLDALLVLGEFQGEGHAWVTVNDGQRDYILETTGRSQSYRRMPPRAALLTDYHPTTIVNRERIWCRDSDEWIYQYRNKDHWYVLK